MEAKLKRMCDEAVDDSPAALKCIPDWLVSSKMVKNLLSALYADDIVYFNEDFGEALFSRNEMGILGIYLNNIKLDYTNYDEDDLETIIHIRLLAWDIKFEKHKALKKELNEELMLIT